jgi:hypothetical protein
LASSVSPNAFGISARAMGIKFSESMNLIKKIDTILDIYFDPVVIISGKIAMLYKYFIIW